ncbi:ORF1C [Fowl aviadenovirus E]|uniref:ORF1C n=2 Tax=Fowl aviadenovirus E TaxID=190065 RepID=A0A2H4WB00_9ADEN|nr:hypothetical protein [Fowl adenovirus 8b]AUC64214.1 ORF1C [Fowl aviadenovirus E]QDY98246.1 ORF1C [Fowl aviadenovirus E]QGQ62471.1 ORF1C [Fowl aviadenovirus E]QGQ62615.1 ORF1C [Fowl aviadenovirus E]
MRVCATPWRRRLALAMVSPRSETEKTADSEKRSDYAMGPDDLFVALLAVFAVLSLLWGLLLGLLCGPPEGEALAYWEWYWRICNARVP